MWTILIKTEGIFFWWHSKSPKRLENPRFSWGIMQSRILVVFCCHLWKHFYPTLNNSLFLTTELGFLFPHVASGMVSSVWWMWVLSADNPIILCPFWLCPTPRITGFHTGLHFPPCSWLLTSFSPWRETRNGKNSTDGVFLTLCLSLCPADRPGHMSPVLSLLDHHLLQAVHCLLLPISAFPPPPQSSASFLTSSIIHLPISWIKVFRSYIFRVVLTFVVGH